MRNTFFSYFIWFILISLSFTACNNGLRKADYGGIPQPKKYKSKKTSSKKTTNTEKKYSSSSAATKTSASSRLAGTRKKVIDTARKYKGIKYVYGGESPKKGFDCSGFTSYVMDKHKVNIPRTSITQAKEGKKIPIKKAEPGDLLFFGQRGKVNHVGIITQNKKGVLKVIHSTSSSGVIEQNVIASGYWKKRIMFARRVM